MPYPSSYLKKKITPPPFRGVTRGGGAPSENKKFIKRKLIQPGLPIFACRVILYPSSIPEKNPPPNLQGCHRGWSHSSSACPLDYRKRTARIRRFRVHIYLRKTVMIIARNHMNNIHIVPDAYAAFRHT